MPGRSQEGAPGQEDTAQVKAEGAFHPHGDLQWDVGKLTQIPDNSRNVIQGKNDKLPTTNGSKVVVYYCCDIDAWLLPLFWLFLARCVLRKRTADAKTRVPFSQPLTLR